MITMKLSPAESKSETMLCDSDDDNGPQYPYGLTISLDQETMAKLGMTDLPAVGSVMQLTALVEVCGVSQYENQKDTQKNVNFQITDMELANGNSEPKPLANRIYG